MSIPERFYRIAKHKFSEIRDRVDRWDEEAQEAETDILRKAEKQTDARSELKDALRNTAPPPKSDKIPAAQASTLRTPDEIRRAAAPMTNTAAAMSSQQPDPLDFHYRLLGVEPGTEFSEVQAAYNKLAARCDPARFPANSTEAQEAERIRKRLEDSYKVLRDALDSTARRFDLLEFDTPGVKEAPAS
jgi:DnaJ-domain-containing protein 1